MVLQMFQDESDGGMTEIRFVPDDKSQLDRMFAIMSECQVYVNIINLEKKNIKKKIMEFSIIGRGSEQSS